MPSLGTDARAQRDPPMERTVDAKGGILWTGATGSSFFVARAPGVIEGRVIGHGSVTLGRTVQRELTRFIEQFGTISLYTDWSALSGYDSEARTELTAWTRRNLVHFDTMYVLLRSKIVAMGVSVANLALGSPVRTTSDARALQDALRLAMDAAMRRGAGKD